MPFQKDINHPVKIRGDSIASYCFVYCFVGVSAAAASKEMAIFYCPSYCSLPNVLDSRGNSCLCFHQILKAIKNSGQRAEALPPRPLTKEEDSEEHNILCHHTWLSTHPVT